MQVDFNGLRKNIAWSFNSLVDELTGINHHRYDRVYDPTKDNFSDEIKEALLSVVNELRSDIGGLMAVYIDKKDEDFYKRINLARLSWDEDHDEEWTNRIA